MPARLTTLAARVFVEQLADDTLGAISDQLDAQPAACHGCLLRAELRAALVCAIDLALERPGEFRTYLADLRAAAAADADLPLEMVEQNDADARTDAWAAALRGSIAHLHSA